MIMATCEFCGVPDDDVGTRELMGDFCACMCLQCWRFLLKKQRSLPAASQWIAVSTSADILEDRMRRGVDGFDEAAIDKMAVRLNGTASALFMQTNKMFEEEKVEDG